MASLMEELLETLSKEHAEYEILLELSMRKTPIIVAGDIVELQKITDEEQNVVSRVSQLEVKREELLNDIANVINKDVKTLKLSKLIQLLENQPKEQVRLSDIHDKLQVTLRSMEKINGHNSELLHHALEMVEFDLNLFQAMKHAPETADYNKGAANVGNAIGAHVVSFDAKQ